jgi:hypothetical protein
VRNIVLQNLQQFNALMIDLKRRKVIYSNDQDYQLAFKLRKTILDHFSELDHFGKAIKAIPTSATSISTIQNNIMLSVLQFLQKHMLSLKMMPVVRPKEEEPEIIGVLKDTIGKMEEQLNEALLRGKNDDADILQAQIQEMEKELAQTLDQP